MHRTIAAALAGALAVAPAAAQNSPPKLPCTEDIYKAFDFWVGEWVVFDSAGAKAGDNSITKAEYGCLIIERWTNTAGQTGQSYNFYDHIARKWRQVWVSGGATIDYAGGLNENGEMVLEGKIGYVNGPTDGVIAPFRGTWTKLDNGDVRQYFQQYDSEKKVWNDWFTGLYKRKPQ